MRSDMYMHNQAVYPTRTAALLYCVYMYIHTWIYLHMHWHTHTHKYLNIYVFLSFTDIIWHKSFSFAFETFITEKGGLHKTSRIGMKVEFKQLFHWLSGAIYVYNCTGSLRLEGSGLFSCCFPTECTMGLRCKANNLPFSPCDLLFKHAHMKKRRFPFKPVPAQLLARPSLSTSVTPQKFAPVPQSPGAFSGSPPHLSPLFWCDV